MKKKKCQLKRWTEYHNGHNNWRENSELEGPAEEFFLKKKSNGKNEEEEVRDTEDKWKGDPSSVSQFFQNKVERN